MNGDDLSAGQAQHISAWLVPSMLKLERLVKRMEATGFPADDPLFKRAADAYESVRLLRLALHEVEGRGRPYPPR